MDANEVVIGEIQGKSRIVVLPLFAESVGQPGESANLHSHRQVLTLDMRRSNLARVGLPDDWDNLRCYHFRGRVAVLALG